MIDYEFLSYFSATKIIKMNFRIELLWLTISSNLLLFNSTYIFSFSFFLIYDVYMHVGELTGAFTSGSQRSMFCVTLTLPFLFLEIGYITKCGAYQSGQTDSPEKL